LISATAGQNLWSPLNQRPAGREAWALQKELK